MAVYRVGARRGSGAEHRHSGWVEPAPVVDRKTWLAPHRNYIGGELSVRIAADDEGEEGATLVFPPAYTEDDPNQGIFSLADDLPAGWKIWVKYTYT